EPEDLLVVVDDVNIGLGTIRLREKGSSGGQKGLASIIDALGLQDFARLRIGIGPKPDADDLSEFVLASFTPKERDILDEALVKAAVVVEGWIGGGFEGAQRTLSKLSS
ncbi:MAG: peptidyl-tRNA hydrolase, partial [Candidatus Latescibacteria bacterium]|nr:peptidyl-tRNA hydrolase [Candidatus Latescibacterota bacterium]